MRFLRRILVIAKYLWNLDVSDANKKYVFKFKGRNSYIFKGVRVDGAEYISIGENSTIQQFSWLYAGKHTEYTPELIIGDNCAIGDFAHITAVNRVVIEDSVLMANRVYISDNLHEFTNHEVPIIDQAVIYKNEVIIGKGAWIGENVCIIGASVGKNCVIGANAVVTKSIPDYSVAVGSPAKVIKKYNLEQKKWIKVI